MERYIHLKKVLDSLEMLSEAVIDEWIANSAVSSVFARCDINAAYFKVSFAQDILDSVYSVLRWGSNICDFDSFERFFSFCAKKSLKNYELFLMGEALKNAIVATLYKKEILSKKILDEVNELFIYLVKDISEYLISKAGEFDICFEKEKLQNQRLLNEYKKAVDESSIVSKTNPKGIITYVNKQFCDISGYSEDELLGQPHNIIRHPDMPKEVFRDMWNTIKNKKVWKGIVKNLKKDGNTYFVDTTIVPIVDMDGDIVEYIGIRHDVTELEKAKEQLKLLNFSMKKKVSELYDMTQNLEVQASTDALTGIYNRSKFDEIFEIEFKKTKVIGGDLSIILMDIDHFKAINDSFGHSAGDKALIEVSQIVSKNIKRGDIFARWGGEEFVILAVATGEKGAVMLAEKLRGEIEKHHFDFMPSITASFGISTISDGDTTSSMFRRADVALYRAKKGGRNRVEIEK